MPFLVRFLPTTRSSSRCHRSGAEGLEYSKARSEKGAGIDIAAIPELGEFDLGEGFGHHPVAVMIPSSVICGGLLL